MPVPDHSIMRDPLWG